MAAISYSFGYGKLLIVPFWYAWTTKGGRLVLPWVLWLYYLSPKYNHGLAKLTWYAAARNLKKQVK